ncbi:MAG TPA: hypothetical protein VIN08_14085 [Ohtaekwangia sp.]|uniref:hypothetical protein n=1 Tax=Ohtaekwangia sp. TaxID=2066019 RepID=UPI002F95B95B
MKHTILTILFLIILHTFYAQELNYNPASSRHTNIYRTHNRGINYFPDSIRVEFPDQEAIVVFELKQFSAQSSFIDNFPATLQELEDYLNKSISGEIKSSLTISAHYKADNQKEITIREKAAETKLLIQEKQITQLLPPGIEIYLQTDIAKVYIYVPDLNKLRELSQQSYAQVVSHVKDEAKAYYIGRKSFKARFIVQHNAISYSNIQHTEPNDMIYASASAAVGVFRDKVYPELTGAIGLSFSDRFNRRKHKVEFTYSTMYLPERKAEGGYSNNLSTFAGISYRRNFSNSGRPMWSGFGAALLVHDKGDFFQGKTARFSILQDLGSTRLSIIPEFYLTDDFKKFQFGLKLHYAF